jgi:hypothetical protein
MDNINIVDISVLPTEKRDCIVCCGPYGKTHLQYDGELPLQFRDKPEAPVLLSCNHTVGLDCLKMWLDAKNNFRFNNNCPHCRKVLYISEIDQRVIQIRDRIQQMQHWLHNISWDNREHRLSITTISKKLRQLDDIINTGAAIDDIYDPQATGRFNGLALSSWWRCTMNVHVPLFLDTIPDPSMDALLEPIAQHNIWFKEQHTHLTPRNDYIDNHLMVDDEPEAESMRPLYVRLFNAFFEGYTCLPSNNTEVVHHSMMPSNIFLKTMAALQTQLSAEGCVGDEWDFLKLHCGNESQVLYKRLCLLKALNTAAHATFSDVEYLV